MKNRSKSDVPARLVRWRERFDKFRKTHKGYRRLPESLWSAAVKLAQVYGVNRTARTLRLDYNALRKRLESTASEAPPEAPPGPTFIELLPSELTAAAECSRMNACMCWMCSRRFMPMTTRPNVRVCPTSSGSSGIRPAADRKWRN